MRGKNGLFLTDSTGVGKLSERFFLFEHILFLRYISVREINKKRHSPYSYSRKNAILDYILVNFVPKLTVLGYILV